ncbi:MAG: TonB-dependent receptor [Bacteroidales bacterium]|nr:TonB-dependent receptor [Bacteroidales bacterium]
MAEATTVDSNDNFKQNLKSVFKFMKKCLLFECFSNKDFGLRQKRKILCLAVCLFLLPLSFAHASPQSPQNAKVTLNMSNVPLEDVLTKIEEQTKALFVINDSDVDVKQHVSIVANKEPVRNVLDRLLNNRGLFYSIEGINIIIYKQKNGSSGNVSPSISGSMGMPKYITGKIVDDKNEPVVGASVIEIGTRNGATTDDQGRFAINVNSNANLSVTCIGYVSQQISARGKDRFDIVLQTDLKLLDEVVVIGYGVQKKVNVTGSVATVNYSDKSKSIPATTTSGLLQGTSPGMYVYQNSGQPGSENVIIRIRGLGTLNDNNPLVIIDGFPGSIDSVNPDDVETVSVLKDAASCAIYGNRGANGVILITTKSAKQGNINVEYDGMASLQKPMHHFEVISNYADYMEFMNEASFNVNKTPAFSQSMIDLWREKEKDPNGIAESGYPNYVAYPNIDWMDAIYDDATYQKHTLSASGSIKDTKFLTSISFMNNPGVIAGNTAKRYSFRVNVESKLTNWLEIGGRFFGYRQDRDQNDAVGSFGFQNRCVPGIYTYYDGKYGWIENPEQDGMSRNNLYFFNRAQGNNITHYSNATAYLNIYLPYDLKYTASFNYDWRDSFSKFYRKVSKAYSFRRDQVAYNYSDLSRLNQTESHSHTGTWTFQTNINWNHIFAADHDVTAMVGFEAYKDKVYDLSATKSTAANSVLHQMDNFINPTTISGNNTDYTAASIFGRVTYAYKNKYLAEVDSRYDGSSRFARHNRWGFFPSFSLGWKVSEEDFMKGSWVNYLKLRASWGKLGNNAVDNYAYHSLFTSGYDYVFGGSQAAGYVAQLSNNSIKWEKTTTTDIGAEVAVLDYRLSLEADFYNKITNGILYAAPISLTIGDKKPPVQNLCEVTNKGIEITLGWKDQIGDFSYGIAGNFTRNWNEVTKYRGKLEAGWVTDENGNRVYKTNLGDVSTYVDGTRRTIEGKQIAELRVLEVYKGNGKYFMADGSVNPNGGPKDGMIRTEEDMNWLRAMVSAGYSFLPNKTIAKNGIWYGDFIYKDVNGDGIYGNENDYVFQNKSETPKYYFGLNFNLGWKGFDFSMQLYGAAGAMMYWRLVGFNSYSTAPECTLPKDIAYDHYFYDPENTSDPRTNLTSKHGRITMNNGSEQNGGGAYSNHWLYKTDYLKIKNITLGYTLPQKWMKTIGIESARIFLTGDNLHTFTDWPGMDPEFSSKYNYFAAIRQYTFGVNIKF